MKQDDVYNEESELHMISNIIKLGIMRGVEPANYYTFYLVYDHLGEDAEDSEFNTSQLRSRSFGLAFFAANIGLPSGTCVFSGVITTSRLLPEVVTIKNNLGELGNEVNVLSPSHLGDKFDSVSARGYCLVTGIGENFLNYRKAATSWSGGANLPPISVICSPYDLYMIPMKAQWSTKGVTVQRGILEANLEQLKKLKDGENGELYKKVAQLLFEMGEGDDMKMSKAQVKKHGLGEVRQDRTLTDVNSLEDRLKTIIRINSKFEKLLNENPDNEVFELKYEGSQNKVKKLRAVINNLNAGKAVEQIKDDTAYINGEARYLAKLGYPVDLFDMDNVYDIVTEKINKNKKKKKRKTPKVKLTGYQSMINQNFDP
jgi:hypothetical protein